MTNKATVVNAVRAFEGKTVAFINYIDPWGAGITITFTDGSTLRVTEQMQAGQIQVEANGFEVMSDRHLNDDDD